MENRKKYEAAQMEIVEFQAEDILTTSILDGIDTGSGGDIDFENL